MLNNPWVKLHITEHLLFNVLISYFVLHHAELKLLMTSSAPSEFLSIKKPSCGLWNGSWILSIELSYVMGCKISTVIAFMIFNLYHETPPYSNPQGFFHRLDYTATSSLCSFDHQSCSSYIFLLM